MSIIYGLQPFIPLSQKKKLKLFLDLEWIFNRLSLEQAYRTDLRISQYAGDGFMHTRIASDALVLDVGCGRGNVIVEIISKTQNIIGIDHNRVSVEIAKEKLRNTKVEIICTDIFNYFELNEDKTFDVIILCHLLEHLEEPAEFLKSISGKSKLFYIEVPDFEATYSNLYRSAMGNNLIYTDADHVTEFDRESLEEIIIQSGLLVLASEFRFGRMKYWCSGRR
ncbi:MAG TPA: class I SAM-dependent methyltransferase [Bacteroidia bacterium]|nr:class I SAM-dependent methyltransferase [Bacteroidia bacterium]